MPKRPDFPGHFIEDAHSIYTVPGSKSYQGFEIDDVLFEDKSPYQDIAIYTNGALGKVLVLDGIVQITSRDEFIYQEMMAHVPLFAHDNPENVLIIGGGDGGILREVLRHKNVKRVVMAEIDEMVVKACIDHMPEINEAGAVYNDKRAELIIGDAAAFVADTDLRFDVAIIDSTDPIGPGEKLFSETFYNNLASILNEGATVSTQGGVPMFQPGEVAYTLECLQSAGLQAQSYIAAVPTYYGGYMTLGYGTKSSHAAQPSLEILKERYQNAQIQTRHYSPDMHLASFVLPPWIAEDIDTQMKKKRAA